MVFAIADSNLQSVEVDTAAERESCTMAAVLVAVGDLHLISASDVISHAEPKVITKEEVTANNDMVEQLIMRMVEIHQRQRKTEWDA